MNQYPLWRYILLAVLIVLGLLYAAPVLYGDDPAIQVSNLKGNPVTTALENKLKQTLTQQKIPFKNVEKEDNSLLIRFNDTVAQLKAQDYVKADAGNDYSVALNLAARTPEWLQAIGAKPMKLGLDLRGGIHFLLYVDTGKMIKSRVQSDLHAMTAELRENKIRYTGYKQPADDTFQIQFKSADERDNALAKMRANSRDYEYKTSQVGTNYFISGVMTNNAKAVASKEAIDQNMVTLRNRVNELGVAEAVVQQQGANNISVDLPGIQDTARAKDIIGKVATLKFMLGAGNTAPESMQAAQLALQSGNVPLGTSIYYQVDKDTGQKTPYLVKDRVVLSGDSIISASASFDQQNAGGPVVNIRAGGSGLSLFSRVTAENVGKPLATVLTELKSETKMVNGKPTVVRKEESRLVNIANINSALGGSFLIQGLGSMREAQNLALNLRAGALRAPVEIVQGTVVGPSLGVANIQKGVLSTEIGSILVIVFMLIYYRLFGLFADFALILNIVFIVAVMAILGATLTLPGIAGIVLTVGMAVDANVLINERIREELRGGMSPQAAIYTGYERAFSTIVDANVTTLIVGVILFAFGDSAVKGFAVSLTVGLLTSMITAIFFTRALVNLTYGKRTGLKQISIGIKVAERPARQRYKKAAN